MLQPSGQHPRAGLAAGGDARQGMLGSIPGEAAFPALVPRLGCERGRHCGGDSGWHSHSQKNERENPDRGAAKRLSEQRQLCVTRAQSRVFSHPAGLGAFKDGVSGLHQPAKPDCAGMLRRAIVIPRAILPCSSPFPGLNYMLWGLRLLAVIPRFSEGGLGALRENQLS